MIKYNFEWLVDCLVLEVVKVWVKLVSLCAQCGLVVVCLGYLFLSLEIIYG